MISLILSLLGILVSVFLIMLFCWVMYLVCACISKVFDLFARMFFR